MNKKTILFTLSFALLLALYYISYMQFFAPTRIALVHFPSYQVSNFVLANKSKHIRVDKVDAEESAKLSNYDVVLVFGPGFRPSEEQAKAIAEAEKKGIPVHSFVFNSSSIKEANISEKQKEQIESYYANRTKSNLANMLLYLSSEFDRKKLYKLKIEKPQEIPSDIFYHLDEEKYFLTVNELNQHLKAKKIYHEKGASIALLSGTTSPLEGNRADIDSLILNLTKRGYNVYPISSSSRRLEMIKEVAPLAVVYIPMGRLAGDEVTQWLKSSNTPLFCPIPIGKSRADWLADPHSLTAGGLTARVVLPEIDGAILPLVISTENENSKDIFRVEPEAERLKVFVDNVDKYLRLRLIPNADKRIGIVYYRGAGQNSLVATGLEVAPSLFNFLKRLKKEGYNVDGLPNTFAEFDQLLQKQGSLWSSTDKGAIAKFMKEGNPLWVPKSQYESWCKEILSPERYQEVCQRYGEAPGNFMSAMHQGEPAIAVARLQFGNICLMPQAKPAEGNDEFKLIHGADVAPPHTYIAPYLWLQKGFSANALIHFGTHGSLEFCPGKQVALSHEDWSDCLVGSIPHIYYYSIANVGEGVIAKRRLHATLISYLTPPFIESQLRAQFDELFKMFETWKTTKPDQQNTIRKRIKAAVIKLGLDRDLYLDNNPSEPYGDAELTYIENYLEELANEKITGRLYTLGEAYQKEDLVATTLAMTLDPLAYSIAKLDLIKGKISSKEYESNSYINKRYLQPIKQDILHALHSNAQNPDQQLRSIDQISASDFEKAETIEMRLKPQMSMMEMMSAANSNNDNSSSKKAKMPAGMPRVGKMPERVKKMLAEREKEQEKRGNSLVRSASDSITLEELEFAHAIKEIKEASKRIGIYRTLLESSPEQEMQQLIQALNGSYISPSPGGDAVRNPNTLPTGRNLYSINAENTPTTTAWKQGVELAKSTIESYLNKHKTYPRKVSYTFWAGEFIESEGVSFAQALYMLGVEPIRDRMNRVTDLRLIPSEELGRPRIDIVVQTSGQLRDIAASRLLLITRAVKLAANANTDKHPNFVADGSVGMEKNLVDKGISPREARDLASMRIFGGLNGNYGTGIMSLVEKGDAWEEKKEIAQAYLNNMGAIYGTEKEWGAYQAQLFEAALQNTDIIVQPRQSNSWGALSLDHVYEFMGGMNLAVESSTGKKAACYFADYRNRNKLRMQDLKEAIGVESRTTILNPAFIKEMMKGSASSANSIAKTIRNTYGWEVMKSDAIDDELWDQLFDTYVMDKQQLGVKEFFEANNPAALQEITAVMIETARKGLWSVSKQQLDELVEMHADLMDRFGASGSDFSDDNKKLQAYIAEHLDRDKARKYEAKMKESKENIAESNESVVLKKESLGEEARSDRTTLNGLLIAAGAILAFILIIFALRKQRKMVSK